MMIQVELWALITFLAGLLVTFLGGVFGIAKFILRQMEKRLDERFNAQEEVRKTAQENLSEKFVGIEGQLKTQDRARTEGQQRWDDKFAHIDEQLADYRERIAALEALAEAGPTHDDLGELHEKINDVGEKVSELVGEFRGANGNLKLIHEFLLNGGGNNT